MEQGEYTAATHNQYISICAE